MLRIISNFTAYSKLNISRSRRLEELKQRSYDSYWHLLFGNTSGLALSAQLFLIIDLEMTLLNAIFWLVYKAYSLAGRCKTQKYAKKDQTTDAVSHICDHMQQKHL